MVKKFTIWDSWADPEDAPWQEAEGPDHISDDRSIRFSRAEKRCTNMGVFYKLRVYGKEYWVIGSCIDKLQDAPSPAAWDLAGHMLECVPEGAFITDFAVSYFDNRIVPVYYEEDKNRYYFEIKEKADGAYLRIENQDGTERAFRVTDGFLKLFNQKISQKMLNYIFRYSNAGLLDAGYSLLRKREVLIERKVDNYDGK